MKISFFTSLSIRTGILALAIAVLTGCATSRDVVTPKLEGGANPTQGVAVRIDKVEDLRHFEIEPPEPSIPSLMDNNITDKALRSRAIARKRNTFGKALGDVLLPESQSVATFTESAMARSFREAGYRVVSADDPDYAQAIPVTAKVEKLWAWFRPGFWALTLESNYDVTVNAAIPPLQQSPKFTGLVRNTMQIATADDWSIIVKKSFDDFAARLKEKLLAK